MLILGQRDTDISLLSLLVPTNCLVLLRSETKQLSVYQFINAVSTNCCLLLLALLLPPPISPSLSIWSAFCGSVCLTFSLCKLTRSAFLHMSSLSTTFSRAHVSTMLLHCLYRKLPFLILVIPIVKT